ncbi:MAG TPA: replication-associated recombination protein A, partial [Sporichthyaceae bacterium]
GEDARYIARRIMILASEDIGEADPTALPIAVAAAQATQLVGLPEGRLTLAQATIALSVAPKSNAVIKAIDAASADLAAGRIGAVPAHLRDAHYPGAAKLGHGAGYRYAHSYPHGVVTQQYAPDVVVGRDYYEPTGNGAERTIAERLVKLRRAVRGDEPPELSR